MSAPRLTPSEIAAIDADLIWHPYGSLPARRPAPLVVTSAQGVRLHLADGTELVDGMSSWWAAIHGYAHPVLDAAVTTQLQSMSHVMFGGLTHEPAARLARTLVDLTPQGLAHVFFSDSGSVAVEVAVKTALQFWRGQGIDRTRLLTWRGGYHGDTFTPMSVCDPDGGMHSAWTGVLPEHLFAPAPPPRHDEDYVAELERMVVEHAHEVAAVIVEPIVQGAGGMRFHQPDTLRALRRICDENAVLLIFDEIATGFGRTGELFAADHAGVTPDIMCVGKALTGGYLSLAATLCTSEIATAISGGSMGVLAHGPTFMANPLACAVSQASIDLLLADDWRTRVRGIETRLRAGLEPLRDRPGVADVRVLGAIGVVQLDSPADMERATAAATAAGAWLRPFGALVYTMPPFVCTDADIDTIVAGIAAVVTDHARHLDGQNR
ncbi:adenosylmethionine--8-amino-7-oxononanoate transaminase [Williamsia sp. CHRR-6]|uniref:adenosylmethionine--8-amino-7-oxononanoate transaminase n=1 Tax=Williamsia sp. CHRR-6 TaxID=2835871 RepID=UPI001BDB3835|nr:adenosylmethionine--8-amino-7-oxononanoate transaminase [Williamsia sp. CHRR-6]MBT0565227.1 adenosylmethionine--8-amino-7-oxononanoate transaminase [Williamsia sp. CHRR-6]